MGPEDPEIGIENCIGPFIVRGNPDCMPFCCCVPLLEVVDDEEMDVAIGIDDGGGIMGAFVVEGMVMSYAVDAPRTLFSPVSRRL